jgi:DNA-binding NtrC family response regulator
MTMGHLERVLLIDQHPEWLSFAKRTLFEAGYQVETAPNFEQAARCCFEADHFDLILVGLDQAEANLETIGELKKSKPQQWRFVVMFPVRQTPDRLRMVFKAGAFDCVNKPYQRDALLRVVADEIADARRRNSVKTSGQIETLAGLAEFLGLSDKTLP